ncbi:MAG: YkgJ family cysteine cluster protein [Actinomycetota bacterium]
MNYADAAQASGQAAAAALAEGEAAAARAAAKAADTFFDEVRSRVGLDPVLARLACTAGCAWCCHQVVGVTSAELAWVAEAVAALPQAVRDKVKAAAAETARMGAGLDQRGWWAARLRCPLLGDDGLCLVHQSRPLPCRAYNSADAEVCRRSLAGEAVRVPVLAAQHGVYGHAQLGLVRALADAGRDAQVVNLALALAG